jgi:hypothetical protein
LTIGFSIIARFADDPEFIITKYFTFKYRARSSSNSFTREPMVKFSEFKVSDAALTSISRNPLEAKGIRIALVKII